MCSTSWKAQAAPCLEDKPRLRQVLLDQHLCLPKPELNSLHGAAAGGTGKLPGRALRQQRLPKASARLSGTAAGKWKSALLEQLNE